MKEKKGSKKKGDKHKRKTGEKRFSTKDKQTVTERPGNDCP
jgi:hypothetical protein